MSTCPAKLSVKAASEFMSYFSPTFSGVLLNATARTLLLESPAAKSD